jgi:hypothetical protein
MRIYLFLLLQMLCVHSYAASVPVAAQLIITKVHAAASHKAVSKLKNLMISEFIWSFGGDAEATQAIEAWQKSPIAFKQLEIITAKPFSEISQHYVECASKAHTGYRAGFKLTESGWRMDYFVAGD